MGIVAGLLDMIPMVGATLAGTILVLGSLTVQELTADRRARMAALRDAAPADGKATVMAGR
jgi:hypothetical protein